MLTLALINHFRIRFGTSFCAYTAKKAVCQSNFSILMIELLRVWGDGPSGPPQLRGPAWLANAFAAIGQRSRSLMTRACQQRGPAAICRESDEFRGGDRGACASINTPHVQSCTPQPWDEILKNNMLASIMLNSVVFHLMPIFFSFFFVLLYVRWEFSVLSIQFPLIAFYLLCNRYARIFM